MFWSLSRALRAFSGKKLPELLGCQDHGAGVAAALKDAFLAVRRLQRFFKHSTNQCVPHYNVSGDSGCNARCGDICALRYYLVPSQSFMCPEGCVPRGPWAPSGSLQLLSPPRVGILFCLRIRVCPISERNSAKAFRSVWRRLNMSSCEV